MYACCFKLQSFNILCELPQVLVSIMIKIRSIHFIDFYYGNAKQYNKIRSTFEVDIVRDLFQLSCIYLARQQKFALRVCFT